MKSGLYVRPGFSATALAAACANSLEEPTTKVSKVKRGFKNSPRAAGGGSGGAGAGARGSVAGWYRIVRLGTPREADASFRSEPWLEGIHSAKTRLGTATVNSGAPGSSAKETWRVGSNQVFSSLPSSLPSSLRMIELQRSFTLPAKVFPQDSHSLRNGPDYGGAEYTTAPPLERFLLDFRAL